MAFPTTDWPGSVDGVQTRVNSVDVVYANDFNYPDGQIRAIQGWLGNGNGELIGDTSTFGAGGIVSPLASGSVAFTLAARAAYSTGSLLSIGDDYDNVYSEKFNLDSDGNLSIAGSTSVPDGAVGTPSIRFTSESTGLYLPGAGSIAVTVAGTQRFLINTDGSLSVVGTTDYENLVTDDDDVPNKKYVDDAIASNTSGYEISPDDHSAVGDGSTNDYTAISDAIAELTSLGGGALLLRDGKTYAHESSITIPDEVVLKSYGGKLKPNAVALTISCYDIQDVDRNQIFDFSAQTATVTINNVQTVYPEWWGTRQEIIHGAVTGGDSAFAVGNYLRGVTSAAVGEIVEVVDGTHTVVHQVTGIFSDSETVAETTTGLAGGDTGDTATASAITPEDILTWAVQSVAEHSTIKLTQDLLVPSLAWNMNTYPNRSILGVGETFSEMPVLTLAPGQTSSVMSLTGSSGYEGWSIDRFVLDGNRSGGNTGSGVYGLRIDNANGVRIGKVKTQNTNNTGIELAVACVDFDIDHIESDMSTAVSGYEAINFTVLQDSRVRKVIAHDSPGNGINRLGSNNDIDYIEAYDNGTTGINLAAGDLERCRIGNIVLHGNTTGAVFLNIAGGKIGYLEAYDNTATGFNCTGTWTGDLVIDTLVAYESGGGTQSDGYSDGRVAGPGRLIIKKANIYDNGDDNIQVNGTTNRQLVEIGLPDFQAIAYAPTITPDIALGKICRIGALTGNVEIIAPAVGKSWEGAELILELEQDATGGRSVTLTGFVGSSLDAGTSSQKSVVSYRFLNEQWVQTSKLDWGAASSDFWDRSGTVLSPVTAGDTVQVGNGGKNAPSFSFASDPNTGVYLYSAGNLAFSSNGNRILNLAETKVTVRATSPNVPILIVENDNTHGTGDVGELAFRGLDSAGTPADADYAKVQGYCTANTAGAEDGELRVEVADPTASGALTQVAAFTATSLDSTVPILGPAGLVSAPTFSFASDPDNGMYLSNTDQVGIVANGFATFRVSDGAIDAQSSLTRASVYLYEMRRRDVHGDGLNVVEISLRGSDSAGAAATYGKVVGTCVEDLAGGESGAVSLQVADSAASGALATILTAGEDDVTTTVPILAPDGAFGAPAFAFANDPDTGLYSAAANSLAVTAGGVQSYTITSTTTTRRATTATPSFKMYYSASTPATTEVGEIEFDGKDAGSIRTTFGAIVATVVDDAEGAESGSIKISVADSATSGALSDIATFGDSDVTTTVPILGPIGTAGAPTFSMTGYTSNGMYYSGDNKLSFSYGGKRVFALSDGIATISRDTTPAWMILDANVAHGTSALARVVFRGQNDVAGSVDYTSLIGYCVDDTENAEEGRLDVLVFDAGTSTVKATVTSSSITSTVPFLGPDGTTAAPTYAFSNNTNTGMYLFSSNLIGLVVNGKRMIEAAESSFTVRTNDVAVVPRIIVENDNHNSGADVAWIYFRGEDSLGNDTDYGKIIVNCVDNTDTSEDSKMEFHVINGSLDAEVMTLNGTNVTTTVPILGPAGAGNAPTYSFDGNTNTGIYDAGSGSMGFAVNGSLAMRMYAGTINIPRNVSSQIPELQLENNDSHGVANIARIKFTGRDAAPSDANYATITATCVANGASAEDGALEFAVADVLSSGAITLKATVGSADFTTTVPILAPDGALSAPAFAFASESNTGFYTTGAGKIDVTVAGFNTLTIQNGVFVARRNSTSPPWFTIENNYAHGIGEVGKFAFRGEDSLDNNTDYVSLIGLAEWVTDTEEQGALDITVMDGGGTAVTTAKIGPNSSSFYGYNSATHRIAFNRTDTHGSDVYVGYLDFTGRDSAANVQNYATIGGYAALATAGSERGELRVTVQEAGTMERVADFTRDGLLLHSPLDSTVTVNLQRLDLHGTGAIGHFDATGLDSASNVQLYTRIKCSADDNTSTSEDSSIDLWTYSAGSFASRLLVSGVSTASTVPFVAPVGAVGAPSYAFTGDTDTGLYRVGADELGIAAGGEQAATIDDGQVVLNSSATRAGAYAFDMNRLDDHGDNAGSGAMVNLTRFRGQNSAAASQTYAQITVNCIDETSTTEDGEFYISTVVAGTLTGQLYIESGVCIGGGGGRTPQGTGTLNVDGSYYVDDTQVVTNRQTNWGAPTGTATRTTFATSTVTLPQLAERVHALIDDLTTHGLIGT